MTWVHHKVLGVRIISVRPSRVMEWPKGWTDLYDHREGWSHPRGGQTNEASSVGRRGGGKRVKCHMKCFNETRSLRFAGSRFWCNLNLKIISPGNRTRDFTVVGRINYHSAVKGFIKLDVSLHGVTVVISTNDREIPGSTPGRYNVQIQITSTSWILADEVCAVWYDIKVCPGVVNSLGTPRSAERPDHICTTIESDGTIQGVDRPMRPVA